MNLLLILLIYKSIFIAYCENDHCGHYSGGVCNFQKENYYSQEMNNIKYEEILENIHSAKNNFVACDSKNCSCFFSTLNTDLKPFKAKGISEDLLTKAATKGTKYQIIDHRLYREKNCMFPARCSGIEHFILKLIPKLPDTEFILNTRDWPQILKNRETEPIPVFSFSKTNHYFDIMYPAWSFWEGGPAISLYPQGLGRWDQHRKSLSQTVDKYPWQKKEQKAFFRGSRTSSTRDNIVLLSRKHPNLVDAQYTKNQAWKSDADTLNAIPASEVSLEEHCRYRFLFNFRGVAASFRFKHLFLCKSLVFHVDDGWLEFFYSAMKPWVHYIPIQAESSQEELKEFIQFAAHNDDIVKEIADEGYKFIWENLTMKNILCYWNTLLRKYTKLLNFTPKLDHNLIEIRHKR